MLLEQTIEIRHLQARSGGNTPLARAIDDVRLTALLGRHGVDQGFKLAQLLFRAGALSHFRHLSHAGQLAQQTAHAAHFLELLELIAEIFKIEAFAFLDLLGQLFGLVLVDGTLGFLDQGKHVAHTENTRCDPVGVERLQGVDLLPHPHELDRLAGDMPHRKRRTAARITIGLGQDDPGQRQGFIEGLGGIGGILAGHGIDHEQRFLR
ncbi:hypothetical protein VRRI112168_14240 [Vreelandella rituensis]